MGPPGTWRSPQGRWWIGRRLPVAARRWPTEQNTFSTYQDPFSIGLRECALSQGNLKSAISANSCQHKNLEPPLQLAARDRARFMTMSHSNCTRGRPAAHAPLDLEAGAGQLCWGRGADLGLSRSRSDGFDVGLRFSLSFADCRRGNHPKCLLIPASVLGRQFHDGHQRCTVAARQRE